ncbi:MAG: aminomethyltransferase family protein, partial [Armatimonadota bacterium]
MNEETRVTPLIDEHRQLGARLAEFVGWEMPLWYAGASDEHLAVRQAAGIFDIGHMGVFEIAGAEAGEFLDTVTTGRITAVELGRCRYTFLLDHGGLPVDDIIVYRLQPERIVAVINAANAERAWRWLAGLASGETPLDPDDSASARAFDISLRDLTAPERGGDRLVGMALQGPASAGVLETLVEHAPDLLGMPRFSAVEATVAGADALISRTGYTGEAIGYELFVAADVATTT